MCNAHAVLAPTHGRCRVEAFHRIDRRRERVRDSEHVPVCRVSISETLMWPLREAVRGDISAYNSSVKIGLSIQKNGSR
jgi:hypothetical protein